MSIAAALTARDLMQHDVVRVRKDASVESAIEVLEEHGISGAPVVDAVGRLVGVFTARDVARSEHMREGRISTSFSDEGLLDWEDEEETEISMERREGFSSVNSGSERVSDWMSTEFVTVSPDASLRSVCSSMAREGTHRVFVVEGQKLVGVISSLDVVRWVAGEMAPGKSAKGKERASKPRNPARPAAPAKAAPKRSGNDRLASSSKAAKPASKRART